MGKKGAHTGMSAKDRSINMMDKFISKNANKQKDKPVLSGRRKDPNIPVYMWPLKDQIEYWENRTDADRFDEMYPVYSYWIDDVQRNTKVHSSFFNDCALKHKDFLKELYEQKTAIKETVSELRKLGVY